MIKTILLDHQEGNIFIVHRRSFILGAWDKEEKAKKHVEYLRKTNSNPPDDYWYSKRMVNDEAWIKEIHEWENND